MHWGKKKCFMVVFPTPVLSQWPLEPSVMSFISVTYDKEFTLETVHRSPGIYFMAEETP